MQKTIAKKKQTKQMNEIDLLLYILIITWLEQVFLDIKKVKK